MAAALWQRLKDESIINIHRESSNESIGKEVCFNGGSRCKTRRSSKNKVVKQKDILDRVQKIHDSDAHAEIINVYTNSSNVLEGTYNDPCNVTQDVQNYTGKLSSSISHFKDSLVGLKGAFDKNGSWKETTSTNLKRRSSIAKNFSELSDAINLHALLEKSGLNKEERNQSSEDASFSRIGLLQRRPSASVESLSDISKRRLSMESISTAVSELADHVMDGLELESKQLEESEVTFPRRRRKSSTCSVDRSVESSLYESVNYYSDDESKTQEEKTMLSLKAKIVEKKFELASIQAEKDQVAMDIRDNKAVLSQLQGKHVLEKEDEKVYDKYENLDIEVNQLKESYEALLSEIVENEKKARRHMEQTRLLHAIYEALTEKSKEDNSCARM